MSSKATLAAAALAAVVIALARKCDGGVFSWAREFRRALASSIFAFLAVIVTIVSNSSASGTGTGGGGGGDGDGTLSWNFVSGLALITISLNAANLLAHVVFYKEGGALGASAGGISMIAVAATSALFLGGAGLSLRSSLGLAIAAYGSLLYGGEQMAGISIIPIPSVSLFAPSDEEPSSIRNGVFVVARPS